MSEQTHEVDPTEPIDTQTFGESTVRIVVDEATKERLEEAHELATERQSDPADFDMFALQTTEREHTVEVEPTEDEQIEASAEFDSDAGTPITIELDLPAGVDDPEAALDSVSIEIAEE